MNIEVRLANFTNSDTVRAIQFTTVAATLNYATDDDGNPINLIGFTILQWYLEQQVADNNPAPYSVNAVNGRFEIDNSLLASITGNQKCTIYYQ